MGFSPSILLFASKFKFPVPFFFSPLRLITLCKILFELSMLNTYFSNYLLLLLKHYCHDARYTLSCMACMLECLCHLKWKRSLFMSMQSSIMVFWGEDSHVLRLNLKRKLLKLERYRFHILKRFYRLLFFFLWKHCGIVWST